MSVCEFAKASAQPDGERDGGIVVRAGDVAAGEHHDHQRRTDGERADNTFGSFLVERVGTC